MNAILSSPDAGRSLAPRPLYEEVAELLRQRIFQRELEPGSWIDELSIAKAYGISRTPLREALKVLAAEGLVTMKVRRGAYVTEVSKTDLADVYHLLSLLESDAAGVVATKATNAELAELQALHKQLEAAAKPGKGGAADTEAVDEAVLDDVEVVVDEAVEVEVAVEVPVDEPVEVADAVTLTVPVPDGVPVALLVAVDVHDAVEVMLLLGVGSWMARRTSVTASAAGCAPTPRTPSVSRCTPERKNTRSANTQPDCAFTSSCAAVTFTTAYDAANATSSSTAYAAQ